MPSLNRLKPSPAMVVAVVALFVALGGVGYSAVKNSIDSRAIKDSTIVGRDVRTNGLTGSDVKNSALTGADVRTDSLQGADVLESSLGTVPAASKAASADAATRAQSAATADRAGSAGSADNAARALSAATADRATAADRADGAGSADTAKSVNGLQLVPIKHRSGSVTNQTVLDAGGLQLAVTCAGGNEVVLARTTVAGGEIAAISDDALTNDDNVDPDASVNLVHNVDDDFGPGEQFELADTATATDDRIYEVHYVGGDGVDVSVHLITDDDLAANNCIVSGYAVVG